MQDRYAGDIGDFGKFGLLRAIERQGLSVGINWYLTCPAEKEQERADGNKPINIQYKDCDEALFKQLCEVFAMPDRSVQELERRELLQNAVYYNRQVKIGAERENWHQRAMKKLACTDVVFLDPDNGLITETAKKSPLYAVKYIKDEEVRDYLEKDKAVIFYQHRPRIKEDVYFSKMRTRISKICGEKPCKIMSMTFRRGTVRDYFILCPNGKCFEQIRAAGQAMLDSAWGKDMGKGKGPILSQIQIQGLDHVQQSNDVWTEIFADYKKARYALWGSRRAKAWHREEETGRYYLWKAYHKACKAEPKDNLVFARILAMMADESRSSTFDYERYHKFVKPSMEAYELAIKAGQHPAEKEVEKIRYWADSLTYVLDCEHAPYNEQIKYIQGYEQLENFQFHDSKPVWFELTGETARLELKFYDTFVTFRFEGILDIHIDADPVTDWIMEFYCYPCFHDEKKLQFDIGFYKIMCSGISVEKIETKEQNLSND